VACVTVMPIAALAVTGTRSEPNSPVGELRAAKPGVELTLT